MNLTSSEMEQVLCKAKSGGADFSELYFEDRNDTVIRDANSRIEGVTSLHIHGAGLYVLKGTTSVYVHTNDTSLSSLLDLADTAASLLPDAEKKGENTSVIFSKRAYSPPNPTMISPASVTADKKIKIVQEMEATSRSAGPAVYGMRVEYFDNIQNVVVVNSEGLYAEDCRVFSRVRLAGTVRWQDRSCFAFRDFARPQGFEAFRDHDYLRFVKDNLLQLEESLKGKLVPSCTAPVIFAGGDCGTFWHETCGHNLESTVAADGIFAGKTGQKIASEKVTLIDDGTLPGMYGSEAMDDEGNPTQKNILIENGIMKGYLCDRKGGRILGCGSTGSGRRQSYTYAPHARMHNTYLAPGNDDEEEMISSVDKGLYVTKLGGGCSGANFSLAVEDGFWIEKGKLSDRVSGLTLSGSSAEIIQRVDRVGKVLIPEKGGSFCGAASGLVPTTAFQPRFRVSSMNIGGTQE